MIHIYYGYGKGKTTAALGLVLRSLAYNYKIAIFRFLKIRDISGEDKILKKFKQIKIYYPKSHYPLYLKNVAQEKIQEIYNDQKELFFSVFELFDKGLDVIVLDEILDLIELKIITTKDLIHLLRFYGRNLELIITGHSLNRKIRKYADLVTYMKKIKHYYDKKVKARKGIEY